MSARLFANTDKWLMKVLEAEMVETLTEMGFDKKSIDASLTHLNSHNLQMAQEVSEKLKIYREEDNQDI